MKTPFLFPVITLGAAVLLAGNASAANLVQHWLLNEDLAPLAPDYEPSEDRALTAPLSNQVGSASAAQFVKGTDLGDPAPLTGPATPGATAGGSTGALGTAFKASHIELGSVSPGSNSFTIALWFNRDGSASTEGLHTQLHIIGANQGQAGRWNVHAQNLNTETGAFNLSMFHNGGFTSGSSVALGMLQSDTWYHFALTRDVNNNAAIYLNGAEIHSYVSQGDFTQGANGVVVGRDAVLRTTDYWSFLGLFDDIRFYDDALSSSEIAALAIPEPSTYAAIFGGLILFGVMIYRRKARA